MIHKTFLDHTFIFFVCVFSGGCFLEIFEFYFTGYDEISVLSDKLTTARFNKK